jgi:hypothetical protein
LLRRDRGLRTLPRNGSLWRLRPDGLFPCGPECLECPQDRNQAFRIRSGQRPYSFSRQSMPCWSWA